MPTFLKTLPLCAAIAIMAMPVVTPAEANHQFERFYRYNDPYSPTTPNLYRRERRSHQCQLPQEYRPSAPVNAFQGWLMPGLIWGDCPLLMPPPLRVRDTPTSPFGSTWR
jgi:hypothetical protein